MKNIQQQLIKNSFSSIAQIIAAIISGLARPPVLIAKLGLEVYGIWGLIVVLNQYSALLDLGLQTGLVKFTSEYLAKDEIKKVNSLFSANLILYLLLVLVVTALLIIYKEEIFSIFFSESIEYRDLFNIALLYSLASLLNLLTFPFSSLLRGFQRYDISNFIDIVFVITNAICSIIFILSDFGLKGLVYGFSFALIIKFILLLIWSRKTFQQFSLVPTSIAVFKELKPLFKFAPSDLSVKIYGAVTQSVIRFSLNSYAGIASVAVYDIAKRLVNQVLGFTSSVFIPFLPAMSTLSIQNRREEIAKILSKAALLLNFFIVPVIIFLLLFFEPILKLWLNIPDISQIRFAASIIILGASFDLFTGPITTASIGFGIIRLQVIKLTLTGVLILLFVLIFGKIFTFSGIIIAESSAYLIGMLFSIWYFDRMFNYNYSSYLISSFFNILKVALPVLLSAFLIWVLFFNFIQQHFLLFAGIALLISAVIIIKILLRLNIISDSEIRIIKNIFLRNA